MFIPYDIWKAGKVAIDDVCQPISDLIQDASYSVDVCFIKSYDQMTPGVTASFRPIDYKHIKTLIAKDLGLVNGCRLSVIGAGTVQGLDSSTCYIIREEDGSVLFFVSDSFWNTQIETIRTIRPNEPITFGEFLEDNSSVMGYRDAIVSRAGTYLNGVMVKVDRSRIGTFSGLIRSITVNGQKVKIRIDPDLKETDPSSGPTSPDEIPVMNPGDVKKNLDKRLEDLNKAKTDEEKSNAITRIRELARRFRIDVFKIEGSDDVKLLINARIDPLLETTFEQEVNHEDFDNPSNAYPQTTRNQRPGAANSDILEVLTEVLTNQYKEEPK
jgi:hypothetical protein